MLAQTLRLFKLSKPTLWLLFLASTSVVAETREFTVGDKPELDLQNIAGSILLKPGKSDRIVIDYDIREDDTDVNFDQRGDRVVVRVEYPRHRNGWGYRGVDFVIEVPASGRYDISSVSSSIELEGISGRIRLSTVSGLIRLRESSGDIDLRSVSGRIDLLKVQDADLTANTVSGSIDYEEGDLSGDGYDFSSVSGPISITHSEDASFRIRGNTQAAIRNRSGGDIQVTKPMFGPVKSIRGEYNDGKVDLHISSVSGSIRLDVD